MYSLDPVLTNGPSIGLLAPQRTSCHNQVLACVMISAIPFTYLSARRDSSNQFSVSAFLFAAFVADVAPHLLTHRAAINTAIADDVATPVFHGQIEVRLHLPTFFLSA